LEVLQTSREIICWESYLQNRKLFAKKQQLSVSKGFSQKIKHENWALQLKIQTNKQTKIQTANFT
jgi:hypothetical protein